jgi:hypothetical protein
MTSPVPSPRELRRELSLTAVARVQRLGCAQRPRCLDLAAKSNWASFSCLGCTVEDEAPPSPVEVRMAGALARVMGEGGGAVASDDRRRRGRGERWR